MGRDTDETPLDAGEEPVHDHSDAERTEALYARARAHLLDRARTPLSTYRVQFHQGFTFERGARSCPTSPGSGSATSTARPT